MFDILALEKNNTLEKEVIVTCVESKKGEEPKMTLLVSDADIATHEAIAGKAFRVIRTADGEMYQKQDFLSYCLGMRHVVQDVSGLFAKAGKPVPYDEAYLVNALKKSMEFRQWLANEIGTAIGELRDLVKTQEAPDIKN